MMRILMSEQAYTIVSDLVNVLRAQDALREICQPDSADYISKEEYRKVMSILAEWMDEIFKRIDTV